ncbi:MAG TPA: hypothetical protein VD969_24720 [Symbiobacteriaceae bacterium]|nr:hypothetical protein [Symbiobacteriaceae bacterium]
MDRPQIRVGLSCTARPRLEPYSHGEDYGWAAGVLQIHLDDAAKLLENHGLSELEQYIRAAEKVVERFREKGLEAKRRDILAGVRQNAFLSHSHPAYLTYFSEEFGKTALTFWERYPAASSLAGVTVEE